jgi:hypothetical protein
MLLRKMTIFQAARAEARQSVNSYIREVTTPGRLP